MRFALGIIAVVVSIGVTSRAQDPTEILMRGAYLVKAGGCADCHTPDYDRPFAGGIRIEATLGGGTNLTFYSPNITPDYATGIGSWTASDFIRAMREGISPSGSYYYPVFPWRSYTKITDEDLQAIYAYLRSLKPIVNFVPMSDVGFPIFNQRWLIWFWKSMFMDKMRNPIHNLRVGPGPFVNVGSKSDSWNRGAYLVEGLLHCAECHTPRNMIGAPLVNQWMAGSDLPVGGKYPPNITPDLATGLGNWTRSDWMRFLAAGILPNGRQAASEMALVIQNTAALTEHDRAAMVDYLMSLDSVVRKNKDMQ